MTDANSEVEAWPPDDALRFVLSDEFLTLLAGLAVVNDDLFGNPGAFATVLDWFERNAELDRDLFARKFQTKWHLRRYLEAALRREAVRSARRWARNEPLSVAIDDDFVADAEAGPEKEAEERELAEAARQAISNLPPEEAACFGMRMAGLPFSQIARRLGSSRGRAYALYNRALTLVSRALEGFAD